MDAVAKNTMIGCEVSHLYRDEELVSIVFTTEDYTVRYFPKTSRLEVDVELYTNNRKVNITQEDSVGVSFTVTHEDRFNFLKFV